MTQAIAPILNQPKSGQVATNSVQPEVLQAIAKAKAKPEIVWESLPKNFILPDDPVESIAQPLLAAALNDSLEGCDQNLMFHLINVLPAHSRV